MKVEYLLHSACFSALKHAEPLTTKAISTFLSFLDISTEKKTDVRLHSYGN